MNQKNYTVQDGILIAKFYGVKDSAGIDNSVKKLCQLIETNNYKTVPLVLYYDDELTLNLEPSSYSKLIENQLIPRLSGIFVASKNSHVRATGKTINTIFFGDRIHFFDEFEDALAAAKASIARTDSILEYREQ